MVAGLGLTFDFLPSSGVNLIPCLPPNSSMARLVGGHTLVVPEFLFARGPQTLRVVDGIHKTQPVVAQLFFDLNEIWFALLE